MEKIENLEELKKAALKLSRTANRDTDFEERCEELAAVYLRGADDEVEKALRREHIGAYSLDNMPIIQFPKTEAEVEKCHKRAKAVERGPIEEKIAEEARQKAMREEYGEEFIVYSRDKKPKIRH